METNIFKFPINQSSSKIITKDAVPTDVSILSVSQKIRETGGRLNELSSFKSSFDYGVYERIERRFQDKPIRGGIVFKSPFRLVNSHSTCQQCLYSFEVDTYGRGCIHDCVYCYAKAKLNVHGYWNNPMPVPVDINEIRKAFYTTFETDKRHKYRELLQKKIPLRIGSMSDSFMWSDKTYKVTQELLKILKFYRYPYVIFTRSDLIAEDTYLELLDKKLASVQFSISTDNDAITKIMEPGSPSPTRRFKALKKLSSAGFWTTVRINPVFPIYPDGYFTDPDFVKTPNTPKLDITNFDMINAIADSGVPAVLAGFGRFSRISLNALSKALEIDMRQFFRRDLIEKSPRDFHFSDKEIRYYYQQIMLRCKQRGVEFTTCYIGNGEQHFWKDQDLWSNKRDCCNVIGRVEAFKTDCREIPFETRLKHTNHKLLKPISDRLHDPLGDPQLGRSAHDELGPEITL